MSTNKSNRKQDENSCELTETIVAVTAGVIEYLGKLFIAAIDVTNERTVISKSELQEPIQNEESDTPQEKSDTTTSKDQVAE